MRLGVGDAACAVAPARRAASPAVAGSGFGGSAAKPVDRRLADERIDARLLVEGEQLAGGRGRGRASCCRLGMLCNNACCAAGFKAAVAAGIRDCVKQAVSWPDRNDDLQGADEHEELPAREAMEFDVVIVGAGPAGLAAAIRLKQLSPDIIVVVVEKGSEVGAHILSGAVIDPIGLDRLLPDWRGEDTPIKTTVTRRPLLLAVGRRARCGCRTS